MARSIFRGNMTLSPNWLAPGPPFLLRRSFLLQGSCERRGKARQRAEEHWGVGGEGEFRIWNDACKEWIKHPAPLPKGLSWPMILVIFEYKLWDCEHAGSLTKHWKGRPMPSALRSELCSVLYKSLHTSWYLMISASILALCCSIICKRKTTNAMPMPCLRTDFLATTVYVRHESWASCLRWSYRIWRNQAHFLILFDFLMKVVPDPKKTNMGVYTSVSDAWTTPKATSWTPLQTMFQEQ